MGHTTGFVNGVSGYSLVKLVKSRNFLGRDASPVRNQNIEQTVTTFLSDLRPEMTRLVGGEITLPFWRPNDSFEANIARHLTDLKIPSLKGKPNLLLHDLGSFQKDNVLAQRLENIFMTNNHSCVFFVVIHVYSCSNMPLDS